MRKKGTMHKVPEPKTQAKLLKGYLASLGLSLPHQKALEASAVLMGFKDWKTYSATRASLSGIRAGVAPDEPSFEPKDEAQLVAEQQGTRYKVPVTVAVTETAYHSVYADSVADAIELALHRAHESYPQGFVKDAENILKLADFYCPDESMAEEVYNPAVHLTVEQFDDDTLCVENYLGMYGEISVETLGGTYQVCATLTPDEPDCSDDERRSECTLEISLNYGSTHSGEGEVLLTVTQEYEYSCDGNTHGLHLQELFEDGTLLEMLFTARAKA